MTAPIPDFFKKTKDRMERANVNRKARGQFGGLTLGTERFYQLDKAWGGLDHGIHLIGGESNVGKCLSPDTPVLMYNGTVQRADSVRVGDLLMGPDSKPKTVLGTTMGIGEMHRVKQGRGNDPYTVNSDHILSVKISDRKASSGGSKTKFSYGPPMNISVKNFYEQNDTFKRKVMGYKVGVDFPEQEIEVEPYLLGLWLGDGTANKPQVTTADAEISEYLYSYAGSHGLSTTTYLKATSPSTSGVSIVGGHRKVGQRPNSLMNSLKAYDLISNKHIPQVYLSNSRKIRLQLLAGLIDADGYFNQAAGGYEIIQKSERLANDITFLARSLGYHATVRPRQKTCVNNGVVGDYHLVWISGDLSEVPMLLKRKQWEQVASQRPMKDKLKYHIQVEPVGKGLFYGFELDGDGLFLLGDFTVTHNSSLIRMLAWDIARFNPKVHVRVYTIDDAEDYFLSCMVAQAARVPINAVDKPESFVNSEEGFFKRADYEKFVQRGGEMYDRFLKGEFLNQFSFVGISSLDTASWEGIEHDIRQARQELPADRELCVFIDNFHDIEIAEYNTDKNRLTEEVAIRSGRLAEQIGITIVGTVELRKNSQRRPILDDIRGASKWKYKARTVILVYSEVGVGHPNPRIYHERPEFPDEKASVLEVHFAKSKGNAFKGRVFYNQLTECGICVEVSRDRAIAYASQIS
jgi:replicative DNA helicase